MTELKQTLIAEEQELIQNPIGRWGEAWQKYMKENCTPDEISANFKDSEFDELARRIDSEAWEMWELLHRQYAEKNPRPTTFSEIVSWEKMRSLTVEHEVMEQIVLQIRTPV
ncbi:MAG: TnpV protein [Oscillospiraceae bacterium]|nr:TnpV protein [Oscillospiraceae bacterium]